MRRLIVNADDFGRTPGINAGTLAAHRGGIVTSATAMVFEAAAREGLREAGADAPRLDLGLHIALTGGGRPASLAASLPTLAPGGRFVRDADSLPERLDADEIRREIEAQISLFEALSGRPPSHLDSHHHSALHPDIEPVYAAIALELGIPARASSESARRRLRSRGVRTPDHFFDSFYGEGATVRHLVDLLGSLQEGTSELMCHPGFPDENLLRDSRYALERGLEVAALCDPSIRAVLKREGIELVPFSAL